MVCHTASPLRVIPPPLKRSRILDSYGVVRVILAKVYMSRGGRRIILAVFLSYLYLVMALGFCVCNYSVLCWLDDKSVSDVYLSLS